MSTDPTHPNFYNLAIKFNILSLSKFYLFSFGFVFRGSCHLQMTYFLLNFAVHVDIFFQQEEFGPKQCGICGDPPNGPKEHEAGGKYGSRMISRYYPKGTKGIIFVTGNPFHARIEEVLSDNVFFLLQKLMRGKRLQIPVKLGHHRPASETSFCRRANNVLTLNVFLVVSYIPCSASK